MSASNTWYRSALQSCNKIPGPNSNTRTTCLISLSLSLQLNDMLYTCIYIYISVFIFNSMVFSAGSRSSGSTRRGVRFGYGSSIPWKVSVNIHVVITTSYTRYTSNNISCRYVTYLVKSSL